MTRIHESVVEAAALSWFEGLGYSTLQSPEIAARELIQERVTSSDVFEKKIQDKLAESWGDEENAKV